MHPTYPHVFSPIKLGPVELRNRFYSSPHAMPYNVGGKPTDDYAAYNAARARGGLGMQMVSLTVPERAKSVQPSASPPANIPAFRALADAVHEAGGKIFAEPFYQWAAPGNWQPFSPPAPAFGPSVAQFQLYEKRSATRAMSKAEIKYMLEAFRQATINLREADFDGIMIHAAHGALLEQFLSPYFNRRTDEYGGSLDNRMRLLIEELEVVREAAGGKMAVGMRFNCDELLHGGYDTKEAYKILKKVADTGLLDFVDLDIAMEPDQFYIGMAPVFAEPLLYKPYVEAVRGAAGKVPVLSVLGRLTSVAEAEQAIASGVCDMVGAARAIIAEPELVKNAFEGKEERSRTCISCNWCMAASQEGSQGCAINPASYRERHWGAETFTSAPRKSKVVVIGAGPGGLEAARVAALRGHDVTVFEARDHIGGAFALWTKLPGRGFYAKATEWWEREIERLGVKVRLNTTATAARILAEKPDTVILATGARYSAEGRSNYRDYAIPGYDRPFVYRPEEILLGQVRPSGKIVVQDAEGWHAGVGIAEFLANAGAQVELLTPYFSPVQIRLSATQEAHYIAKRLRAADVTLSATTYIERIGDQEVTVANVHGGGERVITGVDAVVLTTGRMPVNDLEKELDGKVAQLFVIGDALAVRVWAAATYEGQKFARLIGEPNAPASVADVYFGAEDTNLIPMPADMRRGN